MQDASKELDEVHRRVGGSALGKLKEKLNSHVLVQAAAMRHINT